MQTQLYIIFYFIRTIGSPVNHQFDYLLALNCILYIVDWKVRVFGDHLKEAQQLSVREDVLTDSLYGSLHGRLDHLPVDLHRIQCQACRSSYLLSDWEEDEDDRLADNECYANGNPVGPFLPL